MREIKYKAWHKKDKKMYDVACLEWAHHYSSEFTYIGFHVNIIRKGTLDKPNSLYFEWVAENEVIVLLYTGLKDKNEKEIYEGDIVNRHLGHPPRVITWTPEGRYLGWYSSRLESQQTKNIMDHLPLGQDEEIEIIGNIYENPELLKP